MISKKKMAIYINDKCNRNCSFCYVNRSNKQEMNTSIMIKIVDYINHHLYKYQNIIFVGGEPLLTPHIISYFINEIKSSKINFGIMTNGTVSPAKLLDKINIDLNRLAFNISIQSVNSKDNPIKEEIISHLRNTPCMVNILTVNTPDKIAILIDLLKYILTLKPDYIKLLRQHKMGDIWQDSDIEAYKNIMPELFPLMIYSKFKYKTYNQISLPNKIDFPIASTNEAYNNYAINLVDQDSICHYDIVGIDGRQYLCDGACGEKTHDFGYIWEEPNNPYIINNFGYQDVLYDYCYLAKNPTCTEFDKLNDTYREKYQKYISKLEGLKNFDTTTNIQ